MITKKWQIFGRLEKMIVKIKDADKIAKIEEEIQQKEKFPIKRLRHESRGKSDLEISFFYSINN